MTHFSIRLGIVAMLALIAGCNTEEAKRAMDKPMPSDQFTGFGAGDAHGSKRKAELPKPIKDDMDPEAAVTALVDQLQNKQASFSIAAEEQLMYWGNRQGVAPIVVRKVRPLLKAPRVEHRAPAVRLTVMFGGRESIGDLVECLNDSEFGIRDAAYRMLRNYAPQNFGYDSAAGELARAQSVEQFRRWWQTDQRKGAVQPPTIYEKNPPTEPVITTPKKQN